eukprot:scaffold41149_cov172-Skeletonema_dohrnii-CCMP3373.AAC.1
MVEMILSVAASSNSGEPSSLTPSKSAEPSSLVHASSERSCSRQLGQALQYNLPLYVAFFLSVMAMTFSIRAYNSTNFVVLECPIRVPYLKSIRQIGLISWELCALEQEALDKIIEQVGDGYAGEDIAPVMIELYSAVIPTTDLQSNTTNYVRTTYHFTPHAVETSASWFEAPVHDDILVDADYPYNDDDAFLASFPEEYWSCHTLRFNSRSIVNDRLWILARFFFTLGTVTGFAAMILLTFLLVLRAKDVDSRRLHIEEPKSRQIELATPSLEERKEQSITSIETEMQMLDTNTSGCRQISICFLIAYLMQSLTLLFLNGEVCVSQKCSLSNGARSLIISCILWVFCALLLIFMLRKGRKNQMRMRQMRRKIARIKEQHKEEDSAASELRKNTDNDVLDTTFDTSDDSDTSDIVQKEDV